jgi:hypothetical protein
LIECAPIEEGVEACHDDDDEVPAYLGTNAITVELHSQADVDECEEQEETA